MVFWWRVLSFFVLWHFCGSNWYHNPPKSWFWTRKCYGQFLNSNFQICTQSTDTIGMRSNLDDNLTWVMIVHIWHSKGARKENYWFGLQWGCVTLTWPILKCTLQNYPAWKISCHVIRFTAPSVKESGLWSPSFILMDRELLKYLMRPSKRGQRLKFLFMVSCPQV